MSAYGIRLNTAAGYRQIDQSRIVPQLIARIDLANYGYFDQAEAGGTQPGWICRNYQVSLPSTITSRPCIVFFSIPQDGQDVWVNGTQVMFRAGATFSAPVLYFFALDYVTKSSAAWGIRVKRPDGSITYDSGNDHLNLHYIFSGINVGISHNDSSHYSNLQITSVGPPARGFPGSAAICPQDFQWYASFGAAHVSSGEEQDALFYRLASGNLQVVLIRTDYSTDVAPASTYYHAYTGNPNNMSLLMVDRSIYD